MGVSVGVGVSVSVGVGVSVSVKREGALSLGCFEGASVLAGVKDGCAAAFGGAC